VAEYKVTAVWELEGDDFSYDAYSRDHTLSFGGDTTLCASASPDYHGNPDCVNPEQTFIASLSSCHMLTFLALASKKGFVVRRYADESYGVLGRNAERKPAVVEVRLNPVARFDPQAAPDQEQFDTLHDRAHANCFIANSIAQCVKVTVNARMEQGRG
jgi:organic hydroperoxide reductase OsmC/OhrA